jgi:ADP-ribose pyrophosphatase
MSDAEGGPVPEQPAAFDPLPVESSEQIYDSKWVGLRRDMLRLPNGKLQEHHVVEIDDAVCVLPITKTGEIVFVGQFRHPHGNTHWEAPAGRIEPGEAPEAAARRELLEETGYRAGRLVPMPGFYPLNGMSPHWCHLFAAVDCERVADQSLDPAERMTVGTFSQAEAEALLRASKLRDGFTALALMYARMAVRP